MPAFGSLIIIKRDGKESTSFPLTEERYVFGKAKECDIRINLDPIAEKQCEISFKEKQAVLTNISGFPMVVNSISRSTENESFVLSDGDVFSIGGRSFKFSTAQKNPEVEIIGRLITPKKTDSKMKSFISPLVSQKKTQKIVTSEINEQNKQETEELIAVNKIDREIMLEVDGVLEHSQRRSSLYPTDKGFVLKEETEKPIKKPLRRSERIKEIQRRKQQFIA